MSKRSSGRRSRSTCARTAPAAARGWWRRVRSGVDRTASAGGHGDDAEPDHHPAFRAGSAAADANGRRLSTRRTTGRRVARAARLRKECPMSGRSVPLPSPADGRGPLCAVRGAGRRVVRVYPAARQRRTKAAAGARRDLDEARHRRRDRTSAPRRRGQRAQGRVRRGARLRPRRRVGAGRSGARPTHSRHSVLEVARRFGLTA